MLWVVSPALPDAPLYAPPPASQHAGGRDEPGHEQEPAKDEQAPQLTREDLR